MDQPLVWAPPSTAAAELIRETVAGLLADPIAVLEAIGAAVRRGAPEVVAQDPVLAAALERSNAANVFFWAQATLRDPGARVPANITDDTLEIARNIVRRGLEELTTNTYRTGQSAAWHHLMRAAFEHSDDPAILREALEVMSMSISAYVDATVEGVLAQVDRERAQLTSGIHARRLEVATLILDGAPISTERASQRLGHELARAHLGCVLWTETAASELSDLERAAEALADACQSRSPLTIMATPNSLWAWIPEPQLLDTEALRAALPASAVRAAVGTVGAGVHGFRRAHVAAMATQRVMHRRPDVRLATYDDIKLVALAASDEAAAADFVSEVLGDLASADPTLRQTLRAFTREGFNTAAAARALHTHRNTILGRLQRAEALLPRPLAQAQINVAVALELEHWLSADR